MGMSSHGAQAAYRGYRLQALYTLQCFLTSGDAKISFLPEGREDLDIFDDDGTLTETIQVKSYDNLALSHLSPSKPTSFFHRTVKLLDERPVPRIKLVNFGRFGPEMRKGWEAVEPERTRIADKLREHGFTGAEVEAIFDGIELVELGESEVESTVFSLLQDQLTGIAPQSAFDLLNFWYYRVAEQQQQVTRATLIERIVNVGKFLADRRAHHAEWFTSITPLLDKTISDERLHELRQEFYAGIQASYEHILAALDFRRTNLLSEIHRCFTETDVAIVHGASGQGKTSLAYRYVHDEYPDTWRFSVELVQDRRHALQIARALAGHANAVQAPMIIYVDVSPRDTDWPELVKRLSRHPYLRILVTIREEDFQRANVSGAEFEYTSVELTFDEAEAQRIYERATASGHARGFLDFEEAWTRFGAGGPLLEFVYLLTQTETLHERLRQQVNRIRDEVRNGDVHPDELELLRLVAVASAYEARLRISPLVDALDLPEPSRTLELFEREYQLLRLSHDEYHVEGLHPIRSQILAELLLKPGVDTWLQAATRALQFMVEADLESFILYGLIEHPNERGEFLKVVRQCKLQTWTGLAGVLRSLLWAGARHYIEANATVIEEAQREFGSGWWMFLGIDLADLGTADAIDRLHTILEQHITQERLSRLDELRDGITSTAIAFERAKEWLSSLEDTPDGLASTADWGGLAEVAFWIGYLDIDVSIEQSILEYPVGGEIELETIADVSLGLYTHDNKLHAKWIKTQQEYLESRLAEEYNILFLEERDDILKIHFLLWIATEAEEEHGARTSDPFHAETIERIELIRRLFPQYEKYASHGYGHQFGLIDLPFDSTVKEGIPSSKLPADWLVRVNSLAAGIGNNRFRPETWSEYTQRVLDVRETIISCLQALQRGLVKYLQRSKPVNVLEKHIDIDQWSKCQAITGEPPALPEVAVDPWGFMREGMRMSAIQQLPQSVPTMATATSLALQKYKPYLDAQREYFSSQNIFFLQALNVTVTNFHVGKLAPHSSQRERALRTLEQKGVKTDLAHLTTRNLANARAALREFHQEFRALFEDRVDSVDLVRLEQTENELLSSVWKLWYFFAHRPNQEWSSPLSQIPASIKSVTKWQLRNQIESAMHRTADEDTRVKILSTERTWEGEPALWVRIDYDDSIKLYSKIDELVLELRREIGEISARALEYYVIEENWKFIVIVPVLREKMLNRLVWKLNTSVTILTNKPIEEMLASFVPTELPQAYFPKLELMIWDNDDVVIANQLSESVNTLAALATQISSVRAIPDLAEPGHAVLQDFVRMQGEYLNEALQNAFDTMSVMLDRFNNLIQEEAAKRDDLRAAVEAIADVHHLIRPSEEFDGKQELSFDDLFDYAERLMEARITVEEIKLYWLRDVPEFELKDG